MGTSFPARIIQDFDLVLKALGIIYNTNGATVEGLVDINGHIMQYVGERKRVIWGGCTYQM